MQNLKTVIKQSKVSRLFFPPVTTTFNYCGGQKTSPNAPTLGVHTTCFSNNEMTLHSHSNRQSGAVLIISLIMLLLLTLIGMTGSQVTSLEEKMAGNSKNQNLAFQAAESALRVGETATATVATSNFYTGSTQPIDWTNSRVTTYSSGTLAGVSSAHAPKYIIESLATTTGGSGGSGNSLEAGTTGGSAGVSWYRITAKGMGGTANSVVTLQSIYKR